MNDKEIIDASIFAQAHLDEPLTLARLASAADMSAHHFHRVFVRKTGETPAKYVERLRLEKAAFRLFLHNDPIVNVAFDCGYSNHETLSRAFRRHFGVSPRDYRKRRQLTVESRRSQSGGAVLENPYELSSSRVTQLQTRPTGFIRAIGPYEDVDPALWTRLTDWLREQDLPAAQLLIGIGHDSPGIVSPEKLRFDACVTIPSGVEDLAGRPHGIRFGTLPALLCGVTTHVGPYGSLPQAYPKIFNQVAGLGGYEIVGLPAIEIYRDTNVDILRAVSTTDIYLPVKRRRSA